MDDIFKSKLLALYPIFDKVTGPYLRKDGRKHICLNNSYLPSGDPLKKKTLSWPKALVEVREGRVLLINETADHIDENYANDELTNLQILTRVANIAKSFNVNPNRQTEFSKHICPQCDIEFVALARKVRNNQGLQKKAGPFCSKSCAGRYGKSIQIYNCVIV